MSQDIADPIQTPLDARRRAAVDATLAEIRAVLAYGEPDRAALATITRSLEQLARHEELFAAAEFPPPAATDGVAASTRYRLNPDDGDEGIALYLNSLNPGKSSAPHNHTTWAVIVAVEGQELNRLYRRIDDGSDPSRARIEPGREVTVEPGSSISFLPDDLHSIHVLGDRPVRHFHLYGRPLETLSERVAIDPQTGEVRNYNATFLDNAASLAAGPGRQS